MVMPKCSFDECWNRSRYNFEDVGCIGGFCKRHKSDDMVRVYCHQKGCTKVPHEGNFCNKHYDDYYVEEKPKVEEIVVDNSSLRIPSSRKPSSRKPSKRVIKK